MSPERLAEWRTFAEECRRDLAAGKLTEAQQAGLPVLELIDALTTERARAEKAEAALAVADECLRKMEVIK